VFVERSKELMERLKEREGQGPFDISPYTQRLTLDFICGKFSLHILSRNWNRVLEPVLERFGTGSRILKNPRFCRVPELVPWNPKF
jgi:hypothetical protein